MAAAQLRSLKATIGYQGGAGAQSAISATIVSGGKRDEAAREPLRPVDLEETIDAASAHLPSSDPGRPSQGALDMTQARTTVLPRRRSTQATTTTELRPRFDRVRMLGQGGMGEVELARDNDIRRTVAVKRLRPDMTNEEALHRFADEVRIVGQLEHPSIVPVYDVGRDEAGQVYLVMKHLNGETMEDIIDKLAEKDPAYVQRFTIEYRVHLFLGVLDALRYAHARGVIHRDLKPANIMIGPYGEVTVLDWGIAKTLKKDGTQSGTVQPLERTLLESQDRVGDNTQFGSLAGTPLYMSPEQAAGRNDDLDERSDVFSLSLLLFEWLTLHHPLEDKKTVSEVLAALISEDLGTDRLGPVAMDTGVPMEYAHLIKRGLVRDREKRLPSVETLEKKLHDIMEGHCAVSCHVTLTKRATQEFLHWVDRNPKLYTVILGGVLLVMLGTLGVGVNHLVRAL